MFHEGREGNYTYTGERGNNDGYWLWFAFIVFIIFAIFAFVFLRNDRRNDNGNLAESIAIPLAMKAAACGNGYNNGHGCENYMWDHARDDLKEFGEVKKEIVVQTLGQSREMDNKFHEVLRKQCEDTASIKAEMNTKFYELQKAQWESENARLRDELMKKEIHCPKPMYSYSPPRPVETPNMHCGYNYPAFA